MILCSGSGVVFVVEVYSNIRVQERQWAEIQSHQRKISLEDFLAQAVEKKKELSRVLNGLEESVPDTFKGIAEVIDIVQEGAQWFPGGNKDMKVRHMNIFYCILIVIT